MCRFKLCAKSKAELFQCRDWEDPEGVRFGFIRSGAGNIRGKDGGADRIRTCDLLIANETLYQLSYDPISLKVNCLQLKSFGGDFINRASIL